MNLNRALAIGFAVLLVNSGLVWAFPEASIFYVGNVMLHLGLGAALLAGLWFGRGKSCRPYAATGEGRFSPFPSPERWGWCCAGSGRSRPTPGS